MALAARRFWLPLATALLVVGPASPAFGAGSTYSTSETARSHPTEGSRTTQQFWTESRMRAAESIDLDAEEGDGDLGGETDSNTAPTTTIEPRAPESEEEGGAALRSSSLRTQGTEIPYSTEEISGTGDYPYITQGRIFFRSGGMSFSCSGTVVTSSNRSVVWTAGHCVNHGGRDGWVNKWIFVPGYDDGEAPYGKWTAKTLSAPRGWTDHGAAAYDMGAAVLNPNAAGQLIADVVGSQGIAWNLSRRQTFSAFGYPAAGSFDGQSLWACYSRFGWSDPIPGPNPLAIGCNMTYGSSGGGWIVELTDGSYLNSVTSYSHVGQRHVMYGPYFGDAAANLYKHVESLPV